MPSSTDELGILLLGVDVSFCNIPITRKSALFRAHCEPYTAVVQISAANSAAAIGNF
jgi:hypothetical protein